MMFKYNGTLVFLVGAFLCGDALSRRLQIDETRTSLIWESEQLVSPDRSTNVGDCSKGRCEICISDQGQSACLIATSVGSKMHVELTVNKVSVLQGDVMGSAEICTTSVPGMPSIQKLCLLPKEVDISKWHACFDVALTVAGMTQRVSMGCVTIPQNNKPSVDTSAILLRALTLHNGASLDNVSPDKSTNVGDCSKGRCEICISDQGQSACLIATSVGSKMHVELTVNKVSVVQGDVMGSAEICTTSVPGVPSIQKLCLLPKEVDMSKWHACFDVAITVGGMTQSVRMGCVTIPQNNKPSVDTSALLLRALTLHSGASSDNVSPDKSTNVGDCSKGRCEICISDQGQSACLIATSVGSKMHVELTVNKVSVVQGDIMGSAEICTTSVPGVPSIQKLCLLPKEVDMSKWHACFDVAITVTGMTQTVRMGCVTIPTDNKSTVDIRALLLHGLDFTDASEGENDDSEYMSECRKGSCKLCKAMKGKQGCVFATSRSNSIHLELKIDSFRILQGDIKSNSPSPMCTTHLPTKRVAEVCVIPNNVNLQKLSACITVTVKLSTGQKLSENMGCFVIPKTEGISGTSWGALDTLISLTDY